MVFSSPKSRWDPGERSCPVRLASLASRDHFGLESAGLVPGYGLRSRNRARTANEIETLIALIYSPATITDRFNSFWLVAGMAAALLLSASAARAQTQPSEY